MNGRYILVGHNPVPCVDLLRWARWVEKHNSQLWLTRTGVYFVSTIFLPLDFRIGGREDEDKPPILFETRAWTDKPCEWPAVPAFDLPARKSERTFEDYGERCSTWDEALAQHLAAVAHFYELSREVPEVLRSAGL